MKRLRLWTVILVAVILLVVVVGPTMADELVPGGPITIPVTTWYRADPTGAEFRIRNNEQLTRNCRLELWPFAPPYPDDPWHTNPVVIYWAEFPLRPNETVIATLEGWPGLPAGNYWIPASFWCTPEISGLSGADPFYWTGSVGLHQRNLFTQLNLKGVCTCTGTIVGNEDASMANCACNCTPQGCTILEIICEGCISLNPEGCISVVGKPCSCEVTYMCPNFPIRPIKFPWGIQ